MPGVVRRHPLELAVPVLAAAAVVAFAAGSSSVVEVTRAGRTARWIVLAALLVAAVAVLVARRRVPRMPPSVAVAAIVMLGLALCSTAWSVTPRVTFERAASLGLLFATGVAVAATCVDRGDVERLLLGLLAGAVTVALLGLLVLAVAYPDAKEGPSIEIPWRYRGFGENPNTDSLLFSLALPLAAAFLARRRLLAALSTALLAGSIVASGSRGALVAAAVGCALVALLTPVARRRAAAGVAAVAIAAVALAAVQTIPAPSPIKPPSAQAAAAAAPPEPKPRYVDVDTVYPLDMDVGRPLPGGGEPVVRRTFLGTSGRAQAWAGGIHQALQRPLLGFGFGTEARVFVDRYYTFEGGSPENTYIGIALQLGVVGLVALLALVLVVAAAGVPALGARPRRLAAGCFGVVAAGMTAAVVQSYLYSVGDIAASTFWISAFLLPALALERRHA